MHVIEISLATLDTSRGQSTMAPAGAGRVEVKWSTVADALVLPHSSTTTAAAKPGSGTRLQTEWEVLEKRSNMSPAVLSSESYALPSPGWYALCCDMRGPREREGQVAPRTRDIQHGESLCTYQYVAVVPRFSQRREVTLLAYPNTIMRGVVYGPRRKPLPSRHFGE
jgi:hypothetical protein